MRGASQRITGVVRANTENYHEPGIFTLISLGGIISGLVVLGCWNIVEAVD
jgi:hypothetical protein